MPIVALAPSSPKALPLRTSSEDARSHTIHPIATTAITARATATGSALILKLALSVRSS
jgi:hypothetical protein